jgi:hypothetical protein
MRYTHAGWGRPTPPLVALYVQAVLSGLD